MLAARVESLKPTDKAEDDAAAAVDDDEINDNQAAKDVGGKSRK